MVTDAGIDPSNDGLSAMGASGDDAIVIGAGVGGAALALHLARRLGSQGRVLLVDRSAWPRAKVCGCCLNSAAVTLLTELGLSPATLERHGERLTRVEVRCRTRTADWAMPDGLAIPRGTLDAMLVENAISAGVIFVPGCSATVLPVRPERRQEASARPASSVRVVLRTAKGVVERSPRMVVVADGLAGSALHALSEFRAEIRPGSWIGLGGVVEDEFAVPSGTISLNTGARGYAGLVRLRDGTVNLAAAIDPAWLRHTGGAEPAVRAILHGCGICAAESVVHPWRLKGTALLTRRRPRVSCPGLLVIGDAAGYVEPFTGEGMAWALASARAAAELCANAVLRDHPQTARETARAWQHWHETHSLGRQRINRLVRAIVHRPALAGAAVALLTTPPWRGAIAAGITRRLSSPYPSPRLLPESPVISGAMA